jgi:hypothetical protein
VEQRPPCRREADTVWDELLAEHIGDLIEAVDPVPPLVEAMARAVFTRGLRAPSDSERMHVARQRRMSHHTRSDGAQVQAPPP